MMVRKWGVAGVMGLVIMLCAPLCYAGLVNENSQLRISLKDGYEFYLESGTLWINDMLDRPHDWIELSELNVEQIYYADLNNSILFKIICPRANDDGTRSDSTTKECTTKEILCFLVKKGDTIKGLLPSMTEETLHSILQTDSMDIASILWKLAVIESKSPEANTFRYSFDKLFYYPAMTIFVLGMLLPIPFLVLTFCYVRLFRKVRRLEKQRGKSAGETINIEAHD